MNEIRSWQKHFLHLEENILVATCQRSKYSHVMLRYTAAGMSSGMVRIFDFSPNFHIAIGKERALHDQSFSRICEYTREREGDGAVRKEGKSSTNIKPRKKNSL